MPMILSANPALIIVAIVNLLDPYTIALGGVATGNINAQLAAKHTGTVKETGRTPIAIAKAPNTGKKVVVVVTLLVISVKKIIKGSVIKNLVITDTIDNNNKIKSVKNIEVLSISGLMGEAIKRISNSTSVSDLFK